jgi:hypothetical protein
MDTNKGVGTNCSWTQIYADWAEPQIKQKIKRSTDYADFAVAFGYAATSATAEALATSNSDSRFESSLGFGSCCG